MSVATGSSQLAKSPLGTPPPETVATTPPLVLPHHFTREVRDSTGTGDEQKETPTVTERFVLRPLEETDFRKGYRDLLAVLSDPGDLDEEKFRSVFRAAFQGGSAKGLVKGTDSSRGWFGAASDFLPFCFDRQSLARDAGSSGNNQRCLVVEHTESGRIVSTATLLVEQKFLRGGKRVGHIEDVITHPDFQKRGLAKLVLEQLIAESRGSGCYKLILDCTEANSAVYSKLGLFKTGEIQMRINV